MPMIIKYFCHCSLFGEIRSHYGEIPIHIPMRTEDVTGVRSTNYKYAIIPHPRNNRQHRKNEERIYPLSRALFSYSFIMQIVQRIIPSLLLPRSADLSSIQLNPAPTREPTDSDQRPLINQLHSVHDNNNNNIRKRYIMWVCMNPARVKLIRRTLWEALRECRKRNVCYTGKTCLALALLLWSTCLILAEWSITILVRYEKSFLWNRFYFYSIILSCDGRAYVEELRRYLCNFASLTARKIFSSPSSFTSPW